MRTIFLWMVLIILIVSPGLICEVSLNFDFQKSLVLGDSKPVFYSITAICRDGQQNTYVLDQKAFKLYKFSPTGRLIFAVGNKGVGPARIKILEPERYLWLEMARRFQTTNSAQQE